MTDTISSHSQRRYAISEKVHSAVEKPIVPILQTILFALVTCFLTRQVPLTSYSYIMNLLLAMFFGLSIVNIIQNIKKEERVYIFSFFSILTIHAVYSTVVENEILFIIRSYLILLFIVLSYYIKEKNIYINTFLFFITAQAVFIIILQLTLILFFDEQNYLPVRLLFLAQEWGDIYTHGSPLWKIQLKGNALIPFALFVSTIYLKGSKRIALCSVLLTAIIFAGNFAFILGVFSFYVLYFIHEQKSKKDLTLALFLLIASGLALSIPIYDTIQNTIESKSVSSNPIRLDQIHVLIDDVSKNLHSVILGNGLGNTIDTITNFRDYSGDIYYELQSLYFYNQMGVLFFVFILLNVYLAFQRMQDRRALMAYGVYIFYALFNPYFIDTNNVVAIIIAISLSNALKSRDRQNEGPIE